ncbi:LysR family transcriptional regulator (plasmid) [Burkholderia ambifaria]
MNFTHLLAFYEVARAGSISAGAERLHVSQPAVTREVRELEDRLGIVLFDRLPRGVALTEGGKLLYEYASRIFTLADTAEKELAELAGLGSGHMKIGASGTLGVFSCRKQSRRSMHAIPVSRSILRSRTPSAWKRVCTT